MGVPLGDVIGTFRRAIGLLGPTAKRRIVALLLANVAISVLDLIGLLLLVPFLAYIGSGGAPSGVAVDSARRLLPDASGETVVLALAIAAIAVFVVKGVAAMVLLSIQTKTLYRMQVSLSCSAVERYARAPWLVQQETDTGELIRTATTSSTSIMVAVSSAIGVASEISTFVAVFAAIVVVDATLAVGAIAYIAVAGILYLRVVRGAVLRRGKEYQAEATRMNAALVELVGGIKETTVRGTSEAFVERFAEATRSYLGAFRVIWVTNLTMRYFLEMLMAAGVGLVILSSALSGSISGALVSIGILLGGGLRLVPSLNTLLVATNNVRAHGPAVTVFEEQMERIAAYPRVASAHDGDVWTPTGAFAFDAVGYRYPTRSANAINGLSLDVRAGEAIGVVGSTGSGKSTFVDLLLGLLEPDAGSIEVDGEPLRDRVHGWRSRIGFVPQDIFLVNGTIRDNIVLGLPNLADAEERLHEAVALAHLEEVIAQLPDGLDTEVGERGVRLSGGQQQRVGLARALYVRPSVLVLDEATSALDNETEQRIGEAMRGLHGRLTMVVVAHRLSTVRACDRIVFLDGGAVAGIGPFDELRASQPEFDRLVQLGSF